MQPVETVLAAWIQPALNRLVGEVWKGDVAVKVSDRPDLGDYSSAVAFAVAKATGRPPLAVAEDLADELRRGADALLSEVSASPPAFLNLRLADDFLEDVVRQAHAAQGAIADSTVGAGTKVVVEHTNINPNKAAHVGHLRNACLGDTVARLLRRHAYDVEVQNYIDDTGVQVADLVVGLRNVDRLDLPPVDGQPFDRFCSDVYVAVQRAYESDEALRSERADVQHALETGEGPLASQAFDVATRIAAANLATMARVDVDYDLLTWESDILSYGFWQHAFDHLKASNVIRFEETGSHAGCWVVPFGLGSVDTGDKTVSEDKVLVTSRGIATYTAKDIAYQLWKFGVLGLDFRFKRWRADPDGHVLWSSTREAGEPDAPSFGHAGRVLNVIDSQQSYLQQVVYESLRRLGFETQADASEHLSYGRVTLSPDAARELGVDLDDETADVAMSGRRGIQVFADDLLDRLEARIGERVEVSITRQAMAAGAARYYMLKFSNSQPIAFDFDDALRTSGETGIYLQYAFARANSILQKLGGAAPAPAPRPLEPFDRQLVLRMAAYPRVLSDAARDRSVQVVAKYAFDLATAFNAFYDNTTPIVREPSPDLRAWRAGAVLAFREVMGDVMSVLGIPRIVRL